MKTMMNIKTDVEVKEEAKRVANDLGLSLSAVINAYLKQFIRTKTVQFSLVPRMTPELESLLGSVEKDIAKGKNLSKKIKSTKELEAYFANV